MKNLKIITSILVLCAIVFVSKITIASEIVGNLNTNIGSAVDGIVITPPNANPIPGTYTSSQNVTLIASGASSVHFTTDGTAPTCSTGIVYTGNISFSSSLTIRAISCYPQDKKSSIASHSYIINIPITNTASNNNGNVSISNNTGVGSSSNLPSSSSTQRVDVNNDGRINILDFVSLMSNWGRTQSNNIADFNSDGRVDILDFVLLMANWTR